MSVQLLSGSTLCAEQRVLGSSVHNWARPAATVSVNVPLSASSLALSRPSASAASVAAERANCGGVASTTTPIGALQPLVLPWMSAARRAG